MNVRLHPRAEKDMADGGWFYERQDPGAGSYFLRTMSREIESLLRFGGIHSKFHGFHRVLTRTFPFGIFYRIYGDTIEVYAVIDLRRSPAWIRKRLNN